MLMAASMRRRRASCSMLMTVVSIRVVGMAVAHGFMAVAMRMLTLKCRHMLVLMVPVVRRMGMPMRVFRRRVQMTVSVVFGQVQPDA